MIKETITYRDYNDVERTEDFYFNLSRAECLELELSVSGGLSVALNKIIAGQDQPELFKTFKEFIMKSYGEKSADGKQFVKVDKNGTPLSLAFSQTEAYSILLMKLVSNADEAARFVNGIVPNAPKQD